MGIPEAMATIQGGIQLVRTLADTSHEFGKADLKLKMVSMVD